MSAEFQKKANYEKPKFKFEELRLTESIAEQCWGAAYAWYDANKDGVHSEGEIVNLKDIGLGERGCQGQQAQSALIKYYQEHFQVTLTDNDVKVNTKSPLVKAIYS